MTRQSMNRNFTKLIHDRCDRSYLHAFALIDSYLEILNWWQVIDGQLSFHLQRLTFLLLVCILIIRVSIGLHWFANFFLDNFHVQFFLRVAAAAARARFWLSISNLIIIFIAFRSAILCKQRQSV